MLKKYWWIYLIGIVFIIGLAIFIKWSNSAYTSVDPGVWISTLGTLFGAFLGALLAGKYAIKSVETQNEIEQKRIDKVNANIQKTSAYKLISCIDSVTSTYHEVETKIINDKLTTQKLERLKNILNSAYSDLASIDLTVFDEMFFSEIHEEKIDIKNRLFDLEMMLEELYDNFKIRQEIKDNKIAYLFQRDVKNFSGFKRNIDAIKEARTRLEKVEANITKTYEIKLFKDYKE